MIFWATALSGDRMLLGEPEEAALSFDEDAPADLLRVRFPAEKPWEELSQVSAYEGEELLFRGVVDEQSAQLSGQGLCIELVCRSPEAVLLDNEAPPGPLTELSLEFLEQKLLTPLGLELGEGDRRRRRGQLSVSKGESCWSVLAAYCENYLGTTPYVDTDGLVQCGGKPGRRLELKDVISAQLDLLPCKRISEVWQQSGQGSYDTRYRSQRPGPMRRRYLSAQSGKDPRDILAAAQRDSLSLTVTCAGAWWPGKAAVATVEIPGLGRYEDCPVRNALYRRSRNGETTRLTLELKEGESVCG